MWVFGQMKNEGQLKLKHRTKGDTRQGNIGHDLKARQ